MVDDRYLDGLLVLGRRSPRGYACEQDDDYQCFHRFVSFLTLSLIRFTALPS